MHALLSLILAAAPPYPGFQGVPAGVRQLALHRDGLVLLDGSHQLARLKADGGYDLAFAARVAFTGSTGTGRYDLAVQPDGKILVSGTFQAFAGVPTGCLVRLHPNGALDGDFARRRGLRAGSCGVGLALQPDGKILTGYQRLNPDGSVDPTFQAGHLRCAGGPILPLPDGRILHACATTQQADGKTYAPLQRLHPDGSRDPSFQDPGRTTIHALALQPDGGILLGGGDGLVRLKPDGTVDAAFRYDHPSLQLWVRAIALQPDGRILAGGQLLSGADGPRSPLLRLEADGRLDPTFQPSFGARSATVEVLRMAPDGGILIGGHFGELGGKRLLGFARLEPDGRLRMPMPPIIPADRQRTYHVQPVAGDLWAGGGVVRFDLGGVEQARGIFQDSGQRLTVLAGTDGGFVALHASRTQVFNPFHGEGGVARLPWPAPGEFFGLSRSSGGGFAIGVSGPGGVHLLTADNQGRPGTPVKQELAAGLALGTSPHGTPVAAGTNAEGRLAVAGFSVGPKLPVTAAHLAVRKDGMVGVLTSPPAALRFRPDGLPDLHFGASGGVRITVDHFSPAGMVMDPEGRTLLVGQVQGVTTLLRLTPDGACDAAFGDGGASVEHPPGARGTIAAVTPSGDHAFLVVYPNGLALHDRTGKRSPGFGLGGFAAAPPGLTLAAATALREGGFAAAATAGQDLALVRFDEAGRIAGFTPPPLPAPAAPPAVRCAVEPIPLAGWKLGEVDVPRILQGAQRVAAEGDLFAARELLDPALRTSPGDQDLNALGAALFLETDPERASGLRRAAALQLPPLPTVPPEDPPRARSAAFVNVASAAVRARASEQAPLISRLSIGTRVRVLKLDQDFARVSIPGARGGFIHRDLLSATPPTVERLLASAEAIQARGPDHQAVLLWRALNLEARRRDVFERLIALAFATRRYDLAVDAIRLATAARLWPLDPKRPFQSPQALRLFLFRAAAVRDPEALLPLLGGITLHLVATPYDGFSATAAEYYQRAASDPDSALWLDLRQAVLREPFQQPGRWSFAHGGLSLELSGGPPWGISRFEAPGGYHPMECLQGMPCNDISEGVPPEDE